MKSKLTFFPFLAFLVIYANAQIGPTNYKEMIEDQLLSSPDVSSFVLHKEFDVNLYTGKANINVPIFEITEGNIRVPIQLNYNSGGIKVDEIASSVGLGWSLEAGGNVTILVKDLYDGKQTSNFFVLPDDTGDNAGTTEFIVSSLGYHFRNRQIWNNRNSISLGKYENPKSYDHNFGNRYPSYKSDASPDVYLVNAPGVNTKFILEDIDPETVKPFIDSQFQPTFLDNSGVQGDIVARTATGFKNWGYFDQFKVTNINGIAYTFGTRESYALETFPRPHAIYSRFKGDTTSTAWQLDEIYDQKTNKKVYFSYLTSIEEVVEERLSLANPNNSNPLNEPYIHVNAVWDSSSGQYYPYYNTHSVIKRNTAKIQSITWSGGSVEFSYDMAREDYINDSALTKITVKNPGGTIIKEVQLNYTYFQSDDNCQEEDCKRLKLDAVTQSIGGITKNTSFDYYHENQLSRRKSLQKDYLGYFNKNGVEYLLDEINLSDPNPVGPQLFFYPYQGKNSILPFERKDITSNYREIPGYSLAPNENSLIGLLKKVTYPTGGSVELSYENHTFHFKGNNYVAGGARLKAQTINDGQNSKKNIHYSYDDQDGNSSGRINAIPVYGYPNKGYLDLNASDELWKESFTTFDKFSTGLELTQGNFVGYSRVLAFEKGNGSTEYTFSNPATNPNFDENIISYEDQFDYLIKNSAYPNIYYKDNEDERGKLLTKKVYQSQKGNDSLVFQAVNNYKKEVSRSIDLSYQSRMNLYRSYDSTPIFLSANADLDLSRNLISATETYNYSPAGTIYTTTSYTYKDHAPLRDEITKNSSDGGQLTEQFFYPFDFSSSENADAVLMQEMVAKNIIDEAVEHSVNKTQNGGNTEKIATQKTGYKKENDLIVPHKIQTAKGNETIEDRIVFDHYDSYGNVLQSHTAGDNGLYTVSLWGYNGQYLIAKIDNATYAEVQNALGLIADQEVDESQLAALDALRNSKTEWMITTYRHKPLVGITQITQPNGVITKYEYDDFNRLKAIKDKDDNIVKSYYINYINQYNSLQEPNNGENTNTDNENETRSFELASEVYAISSEFQNIGIQIINNGNSPLSITKVSSDDDCLNITSNLDNFTVSPNSSNTIHIQLRCRLNTEDNWDGEGYIHIWTDANATASYRTVKIQREYL